MRPWSHGMRASPPCDYLRALAPGSKVVADPEPRPSAIARTGAPFHAYAWRWPAFGPQIECECVVRTCVLCARLLGPCVPRVRGSLSLPQPSTHSHLWSSRKFGLMVVRLRLPWSNADSLCSRPGLRHRFVHTRTENNGVRLYGVRVVDNDVRPRT